LSVVAGAACTVRLNGLPLIATPPSVIAMLIPPLVSGV
jgi:hypothetical protein